MQRDAALDWVARDLAADVVDVLQLGAHRSSVLWREDREETVAVSGRHRRAGADQPSGRPRASRLAAAGVPAVIGGTESVFGSPSAATGCASWKRSNSRRHGLGPWPWR